jgi:membrane protein
LYLGKSEVGLAYGAAGSLIVVLLWVYYASQIFLFGAEFTAVYAAFRGSQLKPTPNAMPTHNGASTVPDTTSQSPRKVA